MIAPGARTQHAAFEFIQGLDLYKTQKPFYVICGDADKLPEGEHTSLKTEWHDVNVRDVRGYENNLSFDAGGFKLFKYDTPIGTRFDDEDVKTDLKEMAEMMRVDVGAERAICYNFRVSFRRRVRICMYAYVVDPDSIQRTHRCGL